MVRWAVDLLGEVWLRQLMGRPGSTCGGGGATFTAAGKEEDEEGEGAAAVAEALLPGGRPPAAVAATSYDAAVAVAAAAVASMLAELAPADPGREEEKRGRWPTDADGGSATRVCGEGSRQCLPLPRALSPEEESAAAATTVGELRPVVLADRTRAVAAGGKSTRMEVAV